eukprot:5897416-Prymnesium_polylepis.1
MIINLYQPSYRHPSHPKIQCRPRSIALSRMRSRYGKSAGSAIGSPSPSRPAHTLLSSLASSRMRYSQRASSAPLASSRCQRGLPVTSASAASARPVSPPIASSQRRRSMCAGSPSVPGSTSCGFAAPRRRSARAAPARVPEPREAEPVAAPRLACLEDGLDDRLQRVQKPRRPRIRAWPGCSGSPALSPRPASRGRASTLARRPRPVPPPPPPWRSPPRPHWPAHSSGDHEQDARRQLGEAIGVVQQARRLVELGGPPFIIILIVLRLLVEALLRRHRHVSWLVPAQQQ